MLEALTKSSRSSQVTLSVVVIAILAVAAYNWILAPHTRYLHAAQQYAATTGSVEARTKIIKTKIKTSRKQLEQLRQQINDIRGRMFTRASAKEFFRSVETMGARNNCAISSINFLTSKQAEQDQLQKNQSGVNRTSAAVNFSGRYGDIINFLGEVLNRTEKVRVKTVAMSSSPYNNQLLDCEVVFMVYVAEEQESNSNE